MHLSDYAGRIALAEAFHRPPVLSSKEEGTILARVLEFLATEHDGAPLAQRAGTDTCLLLRAHLNVRPPEPVPPAILEDLDRLLWTARVREGIEHAGDVPSIAAVFDDPGAFGDVLSLWRGDIARLDADAIVNAANSALLGCFSPLHGCIDNVIHSAAGPRLRDDCSTIMALLDHEEATGKAKITRAYNLPSRFVLHTVGPIVRGELTKQHRVELASSYTSCLDLAAETEQIRTIAFCCISTGVFGFPPDAARRIAVRTVSDWLDRNPGIFEKVIFNVFTEQDHERYSRLFAR